jgi:phosphohistidine phosphatase
MEIYILRHGIAEVARAGMSDADRALVGEGRKKLASVLRMAKAAGVAPSLIVTSPYLRAVQSAEVAAKQLGYTGEILKIDALRPGGSPREAWEEIRPHQGSPSVLISGHEPLLSNFAAFLLGVPALLIDLKKGSLLRIDLDHLGAEPRGILRWYLTPKFAR